MLAVSFFFVLAGGMIILVSVVGILLNLLNMEYSRWKKWGLPLCGGVLSLLLGLLIAMS
ncbi:hypothetical protein [Desulfotomaculum sp. 1211_IL3151]|uniref:hypothetical protein n=1 Tax=Desulfotomaculum sp. 1211_IL3151 TaxID=3084055 RepID=UPI002FD8A174